MFYAVNGSLNLEPVASVTSHRASYSVRADLFSDVFILLGRSPSQGSYGSLWKDP